MKPIRGVARDLPLPRLAAKLRHDLEHLAQARRADRLAVREAAAVGVDREASADPGRARGVQRRLLAVLAETALGQVDQLCPRLGVLHLDDIDVAGLDARPSRTPRAPRRPSVTARSRAAGMG